MIKQTKNFKKAKETQYLETRLKLRKGSCMESSDLPLFGAKGVEKGQI